MPIEQIQKAKDHLESIARVHQCPQCGTEVTTYDESATAEVHHWCPQTFPRRLVHFFPPEVR